MLSDARLAELIEFAAEDLRFLRMNVSAEDDDSDDSNLKWNEDILNALTELAEARKLLRESLPHLHHTGATHHEQCACSVKRRIEAALGKGDGKRESSR